MRFIIYIFILINTSIYSQGFVTPESEGSIQKCFDSEYTCKLTQLSYDVYNTLIVSKSKIIDGNNATLILKYQYFGSRT